MKEKKSIYSIEIFVQVPKFQWPLLLLKMVKVHLAGTQLIGLEKCSSLLVHRDHHMGEEGCDFGLTITDQQN